MQQSAVPRCAFRSEAREVSGSETARVRHASRRRCGRTAARRARTAADDGCFDYGVAPLGRRTVNTEPLPGSLVAVTSPPIMRASFNGPDPFT